MGVTLQCVQAVAWYSRARASGKRRPAAATRGTALGPAAAHGEPGDPPALAIGGAGCDHGDDGDPWNPENTSRWATFLWQARDDRSTAFDRTASSNLLRAATFFLAVDDRSQLKTAFHLMDSRPMDSSLIERRVLFVRIADELVRGRDGKPFVAQMQRMFARDYYDALPEVPLLAKLLQSLKPRLPAEHFDILTALDLAIHDPAHKSSLASFSRWQSA